jgi:hypothetical protein
MCSCLSFVAGVVVGAGASRIDPCRSSTDEQPRQGGTEQTDEQEAQQPWHLIPAPLAEACAYDNDEDTDGAADAVSPPLISS